MNGNVNAGLNVDGYCTIENAVIDFTITNGGYGVIGYNNFVINNGTYSITGPGTAIYSDEELTINNGIYTLTNVSSGICARKALTINHGKVNITAINQCLVGEQETVFIRGTFNMKSADTAVIEANGTITFSYCNFECSTHCSTIGVLNSAHSSVASHNMDYYFKDTEDGEWYQDNTKNIKHESVKYLKGVASYNHITVWVEDISVEEGTDISSMVIPYGFGWWNDRRESTLNNHTAMLTRAAALFTVTVNCDGTTPGTYDYVLTFVPEYEGNIDDNYDIVFGNEIGHFIVTAAPVQQVEPEPDPLEDSTPPTDTQPSNSETIVDENTTRDPAQDQATPPGIENHWEMYRCIGLIVLLVDVIMFIYWLFTVIYLFVIKHRKDNFVFGAKLVRIIGLVGSIALLAFAIVAITTHACRYSIAGIVGAAVITALFGISYVISVKRVKIVKDELVDRQE